MAQADSGISLYKDEFQRYPGVNVATLFAGRGAHSSAPLHLEIPLPVLLLLNEM